MGERLLFVEEVADVLGVKAQGIKGYLLKGNKARAAGTDGPGTFPAPVSTIRRRVFNGHHEVSVMANQWRASDVASYVEHRPEAREWPEERRAAAIARLREMEDAG